MIGDVRDREARVLEEPRRTDEAGHGEIALRSRGARTEEPAHHRAGHHLEMTREQAYVPDARRAGEDRLEEAPAIVRRTSEIDGELPEHAPMAGIARIRHQCAAELAPPGGQ